MKILFQLNHPAHYHLFKHAIASLRGAGHEICIVVRDKDVLLDLVKGEKVVNIASKYRASGKAAIVCDLLARDWRVLRLAKRWKPDLMAGTAIEISHAGRILGIPSLFFGEDDARVVLSGSLINKPFCTHILSPSACDNWIWNRKTIFYDGYQKLAYLHPRYFRPNREKVRDLGDSYSLLRISALAAHHDRGRKGVGIESVRRIVALLERYGNVFVTSEKALPADLDRLRYPGNVEDIHHALYFSRIFVGDSQSMAMEAAMLGVPNVRVSDFAGSISVLNEVERRYELSIGLHPGETDRLQREVERLAASLTERERWERRRNKMLREKISVTDFIVWTIGEYPRSVELMAKKPEYQQQFRVPVGA